MSAQPAGGSQQLSQSTRQHACHFSMPYDSTILYCAHHRPLPGWGLVSQEISLRCGHLNLTHTVSKHGAADAKAYSDAVYACVGRVPTPGRQCPARTARTRHHNGPLDHLLWDAQCILRRMTPRIKICAALLSTTGLPWQQCFVTAHCFHNKY